VAEVVFGFFEHTADAFLFRDVIVQFLNMSFGLFRALAFALSAASFSFLCVARRSFDLAHVTVVAEIHDYEDRNGDEKRPEAKRAKAADDEAGARSAGEITDRDPKEVAAPRVPERLVCLECTGNRTDSGVEQVL